MKRNALALALVMLLGMLIALPANAADAPAKLTILTGDGGRVVQEDNPVWLELEKRTNTELTLMLLPNAELQQKINTMAASNTLPDIVKYTDFYPYAAQDVMLDLGELVDTYGGNLKKHIPEHLWAYGQYQGKQVAIPYYNEAGKYTMAVRQDWLDKLGLAIPATLDELYNVSVAFATKDPDGNGEADTYAFGHWDDFMPIYGAYGIIGGGASGQQRYYYVKDDALFTTIISQEYKGVLTYLNQLWDAKAIDPDFFIMQTDQYRQKLATGKIGMLNQWWSLVPDVLYNRLGFGELNPGGKWSIIESAPKGPGGPFGDNGMRSSGDYQGATWLAANTKYPVEAMKFLDFLITDEGFELSGYGLQGVHYTSLLEPRTAEGQKAYDERWLDAFHQVVGRRNDLFIQIREAVTTDHQLAMNRYTNAALSYNLYVDALFGLPATQAELDYDADLNAFEIENRIAFITGERSLDQFDQYVKEWLDRGGRDILAARVAQHNELRNTQYTAGQQ